jgi:hypothetical protein
MAGHDFLDKVRDPEIWSITRGSSYSRRPGHYCRWPQFVCDGNEPPTTANRCPA